MTHGLLYSLIFVLLITLSVYPGLCFKASFGFMSNKPNKLNWTLIMIQIIFNGFDTVGRYLGSLKSFDLSIPAINAVSGLRILFVPSFLAVTLQWPPGYIFNTDWFKMTNIVLMALTNGYLITRCGTKAPETV